MSRRPKITLPDGLAAQLDKLAVNTGEPVARLAGQMVRQGIAEAAPNGDVRQPRVETLCAIVVWRQLIDDTCRDPREELAFQVSLSDYGHTFRQEGGSVTRAWRPGAPPDGWIR